ncbi:unnamed protein product [Adineta ricciae]|uniref:PABC domain-containing protein n=1 Tax=Adineta ricciae TaxID=249248 RepID=A0A814YW64_ADIRI|nr:unnamed protein product [Adineta ricciae]CAF1290646.1 unnamed protein product [Adineta ricciae]
MASRPNRACSACIRLAWIDVSQVEQLQRVFDPHAVDIQWANSKSLLQTATTKREGKQAFGECISPIIQQLSDGNENDKGKITGMLLELGDDELQFSRVF